MSDPRRGRIWSVGADTIRSPHSNLIFKKGPVKAELAGEWISSKNGRRVRAFYGRDQDGQWRGQAVDVGGASDADTSPYCYIRILDDREISLAAVTDMVGEMDRNYLEAVTRDRRVYEDENYYQIVKAWLSEMLEARREARLNLEAGMEALGLRRNQ